MPRITISYRREDTLDITGRIFDRLAGHFGREAVFRDIDNIPPGADFRRHIDRVLDESDVILAIVGTRWIGPNKTQLRLASPADPVRLEIETALRKDKPLIPVLVSRAVMPHPDVLPSSIHDFVYRNAVQVDSGQDFDVHVGRLISAIEELLRIDQERMADEAAQGAPPLEPTPRPKRAAEAARQAEEEKRQAETTPRAKPNVASVAPPVGRPIVQANGGHTVRWAIGLLVLILGIIGAAGWWVLVEQPAEVARRAAAAAEKARAEDRAQAVAAISAAAGKAQQEEQGRQAAAAKAHVKPPTGFPQLTYGTWTLRDAVDKDNTDWSNSKLKFDSQTDEPDGLSLHGTFEWRRNGVRVGTETFSGHYTHRTRVIIFETINVSGPLAKASYSAKVSPDDLELVDGRWQTKYGNEGGPEGRWKAVR
jgi:hypothetical protein